MYEIEPHGGTFNSIDLDALLKSVPKKEIISLEKFIKREFKELFTRELRLFFNEEEVKREIKNERYKVQIHFSSEYPSLLLSVSVKNRTCLHVVHDIFNYFLADYIKGIKKNSLTYSIEDLGEVEYIGKTGVIKEGEEIERISKETIKFYFEILEKYEKNIKQKKQKQLT